MSETRLTPARRAELGALCGPGIKGRGLTRIHARSRALPEALAEVDRLTEELRDVREADALRQSALETQKAMLIRLTARWEALKAEVTEFANQADHSVSTYRMGAKAMASRVVEMLARLEREP